MMIFDLLSSLRSNNDYLAYTLRRQVCHTATDRTNLSLDATKKRAVTYHCSLWRKERDSNPRTREDQRFSRPPHSTTLPSFRVQRYNLFSILQNFYEKVEFYIDIFYLCRLIGGIYSTKEKKRFITKNNNNSILLWEELLSIARRER